MAIVVGQVGHLRHRRRHNADMRDCLGFGKTNRRTLIGVQRTLPATEWQLRLTDNDSFGLCVPQHCREVFAAP